MLKNVSEYSVYIIAGLTAVVFLAVMIRGMAVSFRKKKYRDVFREALMLCLLFGAAGWFLLYYEQPVHTDIPFVYEELPADSGIPSAEINGNIPYFTEEEKNTDEYESYGKLDRLGRCTPAMAMIGRDMMPGEEREEIDSIRPSGFVGAKYDDLIEDGFLYNRCHLIAFELTGENANAENLITGTRYMNTMGMLPYENMTASYIRRTGNHVLYRVTPVFLDGELVCRGVLMEAWSVEDDGEGICFCVFCRNVQPGIDIDYRSGKSTRAK